eukprot:1158893-Pelagomonas_calceolata.AAC.17
MHNVCEMHPMSRQPLRLGRTCRRCRGPSGAGPADSAESLGAGPADNAEGLEAGPADSAESLCITFLTTASAGGHTAGGGYQ